MSFKVKFKYGDEEHEVNQVHKGPIKTGNVLEAYNNPQYETIEVEPRQQQTPNPEVKPPPHAEHLERKVEELEVIQPRRLASSRTNEQGQEEIVLQATKFHVEPREEGNLRYATKREFTETVLKAAKPGSPIAKLHQHQTAQTLPESKTVQRLPEEKEKAAEVVLHSKPQEQVLQQPKAPRQPQAPADKAPEKPASPPKKIVVEQVSESSFNKIDKKAVQQKGGPSAMRVSARGVKDGEVELKAPRFHSPKKTEGDVKHTTTKEYVSSSNNKYQYKEMPEKKEDEFTGCFSCFRSKPKGVKVKK